MLLGPYIPGLEVQGVLVQLGSGVVVEVLIVGDDAREDFLESALGSGINSGMLQRPLICSNSCTCHIEMTDSLVSK